jgi:hypothetical protein
MSDEKLIKRFSIISTMDGYMVEQEDEDDGTEYIHAPDGDNLFDTYAQASVVLAQHLLKRVL